MKFALAILCAWALFAASPLGSAGTARATEACMSPAPETFAGIVASAPLIVHGKILSQDEAAKSTEIEILETLKGETAGKTIRISGWLHDYPPLFVYEKGAELIFLLTPASDSLFRLSNDSWKDCVPSLSAKLPDGRFAVNSTLMTKDSFKQAFLSAKE